LKCLSLGIRCPKIELTDHVTKQCTDGTYFGSRCSFRCDKGYNLVGEENTECTGESQPGTWTQLAPSCESKYNLRKHVYVE